MSAGPIPPDGFSFTNSSLMSLTSQTPRRLSCRTHPASETNPGRTGVLPPLQTANRAQAAGATDLSTFAGLPATTAPGGTSFVTTLPAPMSAFSPTVTPHRSVAPDPIDAPRLTRVGTQTQSASVCKLPSPFVARG